MGIEIVADVQIHFRGHRQGFPGEIETDRDRHVESATAPAGIDEQRSGKALLEIDEGIVSRTTAGLATVGLVQADGKVADAGIDGAGAAGDIATQRFQPQPAAAIPRDVACGVLVRSVIGQAHGHSAESGAVRAAALDGRAGVRYANFQGIHWHLGGGDIVEINRLPGNLDRHRTTQTDQAVEQIDGDRAGCLDHLFGDRQVHGVRGTRAGLDSGLASGGRIVVQIAFAEIDDPVRHGGVRAAVDQNVGIGHMQVDPVDPDQSDQRRARLDGVIPAAVADIGGSQERQAELRAR